MIPASGAAVRVSHVGQLRCIDNGSASTLFIGDLGEFAPVSLVLAVQREIPTYLGGEGNLQEYPLFHSQIPQPREAVNVQMNVKHTVPRICVDEVRITAIASSSMVQAGSCRSVRAESRVKHIRQLLRVPMMPDANR